MRCCCVYADDAAGDDDDSPPLALTYTSHYKELAATKKKMEHVFALNKVDKTDPNFKYDLQKDFSPVREMDGWMDGWMDGLLLRFLPNEIQAQSAVCFTSITDDDH